MLSRHCACLTQWVLTLASRNRKLACPPTVIAAFTTPNRNMSSNAMADHVKAQGIKRIQAFCFCSWCAHAIPPSRALNVVSVAWRAGGSPGAPEARLARRRLALVSSISKQPASTRFPRPIKLHPQRTDNGVLRGHSLIMGVASERPSFWQKIKVETK